MTGVDFSTSYPDRPEPLSDALRLPEVDLSVFDEGDADGEVAALVQQLHVVNLGHSQLEKGTSPAISSSNLSTVAVIPGSASDNDTTIGAIVVA